MGVQALTAEDVGLEAIGWTGDTPLWYYILRESAVKGGGDRLGPVGGRIVTEVMLVILARDPFSLLGAAPTWRPQGSLIDLLLQRAPMAPSSSGGQD